MAKAISGVTRKRTSSKAELQREFKEIEAEVAGGEPVAEKEKEAAESHKAEIKAATSTLSADGVVQKLTGVGLEIQRFLNNVSQQLVEQVNLLEQLSEAVQLERTELERLHKIDVAATALDQLVFAYRQRQQQLEAEQQETRARWEREKEEQERQRQEEETELKKARQREQEEYAYKMAQERKKAQNEFEEHMKKQEKENREKQEALEKSWSQREASLKAREQELAELKKEVDSFPAKLKRETDAAVKAALENCQRQFDMEKQMLQKDMEAERRAFQLQSKALEETIAKQNAQIAELSMQLQAAQRQVQDIALRALDSAAGAKTLEEIRSIAREQAKRDAR